MCTRLLRAVANLLAGGALPPALRAFALEDAALAAALARWAADADDLPLRSEALRALANRRALARGDSDDGDERRVTYLDGVHPLHLSAPARDGSDESDEDAYDVDVVFLHGLLGCPFETWVCGEAERAVWAREWLVADLRHAGRRPRVLSLGYDAQLRASDSAWRTMGLERTGDEVAAQLAAARVGAGRRPVLFVTHSLGGVLLKQVLHDSAARGSDGRDGTDRDERAPPLVDSVRGVVFFGVPHHGSPVAQTVRALRPESLGLDQHPVTAHLHGSAHSAMLNASCAALFADRGIAALSVGETRPCRLPLVGLEALVVPPESADPGFGAFVKLPDATHMSVCKPRARDDDRYVLARDFIVQHAAPRAAADETDARNDDEL